MCNFVYFFFVLLLLTPSFVLFGFVLFYEYVFFICCYLISNFVLVKLLIASPALNTQHIRSINHSICLAVLRCNFCILFVSFRFVSKLQSTHLQSKCTSIHVALTREQNLHQMLSITYLLNEQLPHSI